MIEPLSRARLPEVILQPGRRAGLDFAPGLVERMVEETSGGDALPLLAYTLRELYQRAGPDGICCGVNRFINGDRAAQIWLSSATSLGVS